MEKTDISGTWQLSLEVLSVESQQIQGVLKRFNRVYQVWIDKDVDIELLVTPENL